MAGKREGGSFHVWGLVVFGILVVLALGFFFGRATFAPVGGYPMGFHPFPFFGFVWGFFGIFILFLVLKWLFWPWGWGYHRGYWRADSAYRILRERYAKGEITKEQFEQARRDLEQHD